jgi:hypothetical protein
MLFIRCQFILLFCLDCIIPLGVFASRALGAQSRHRDGVIRAIVKRPDRAGNSERRRRNPPVDALRVCGLRLSVVSCQLSVVMSFARESAATPLLVGAATWRAWPMRLAPLRHGSGLGACHPRAVKGLRLRGASRPTTRDGCAYRRHPPAGCG